MAESRKRRADEAAASGRSRRRWTTTPELPSSPSPLPRAASGSSAQQQQQQQQHQHQHQQQHQPSPPSPSPPQPQPQQWLRHRLRHRQASPSLPQQQQQQRQQQPRQAQTRFARSSSEPPMSSQVQGSEYLPSQAMGSIAPNTRQMRPARTPPRDPWAQGPSSGPLNSGTDSSQHSDPVRFTAAPEPVNRAATPADWLRWAHHHTGPTVTAALATAAADAQDEQDDGSILSDFGKTPWNNS